MEYLSFFREHYFGGVQLIAFVVVIAVTWIILRSIDQNNSTKAEFWCKFFGFTIETKRPPRK